MAGTLHFGGVEFKVRRVASGRQQFAQDIAKLALEMPCVGLMKRNPSDDEAPAAAVGTGFIKVQKVRRESPVRAPLTRMKRESLAGREPQSSHAGKVGTAKQSSQPLLNIIASWVTPQE
jgi:hypothetical protein